jgi:hypothetical protein
VLTDVVLPTCMTNDGNQVRVLDAEHSLFRGLQTRRPIFLLVRGYCGPAGLEPAASPLSAKCR